ncbi:transketolase [Salinisphaera sp. PC39]|uniref:transketolase n=1 Tax=Salinisphaera sp. PC39 TaxID=1304156 RepID=UPI003341BD1A
MPARRELANAIRVLAMDAVQRANSGHPGMPMGMADIAEVLWNDFIRVNPANPDWPDRDRFVISNGHGSMLQYALLHLTGYDLPLEEIKNFRQLHSKTPGHPEVGITPGVETTTGPLGQGLANAVGMAVAEAALAAQFNRDGLPLVNHYTYCFTGDGCLMEGISHEACSLAGTLRLGKLIVFYDDNGISIDGEVAGWFTDDTPGRFEAYGWQVIRNVDGHDAEEIKTAIETARRETDKPTLICCKTVIGWGSPNKQGTEGVHGAALGDDEIAAAREALNWPHGEFEIPQPIYDAWDKRAAGEHLEREWGALHTQYREKYPELAAEFDRRVAGELPDDWERVAADFVARVQAEGKTQATRKASQGAIEGYAPYLPELLGGSADLSGSNCTAWKGHQTLHGGDYAGNYIYYGVREFAMTAIGNGIALHGGFVPFSGTFLTFSDYARNAVRLAALMRVRNILVYTHDSIGLGEDGPTHQAVEHLASLRLIPNLHVWRPADDVETAAAWRAGIERADGPVALALSRQNVPHLDRSDEQLADIARGGYILREPEGGPEAILIATGSEVGLALEAADRLAADGRRVRVVSMPCLEVFAAQPAEYRERVLPSAVRARVAVEAGVTPLWRGYVGDAGAVVGVDCYGESAPGPAVYEYLGVTADRVAEAVTSVLAGGQAQPRTAEVT